MRQIIISIIVLTLLLGCNNKSKKENTTVSEEKSEQTDSDFQKYMSTLDQIPLPLETSPLGQLPELSKITISLVLRTINILGQVNL